MLWAALFLSHLMKNSLPWFYYCTWAFWSASLYILLLMFYNPSVIVQYDIRTKIMSSFPQGWGFFTKSPVDPMIVVYRQDSTKRTRITYLNYSADNYWGFSKTSRAVGIEMAKILPLIPKSAWRESHGVPRFSGIPTDTVKSVEHMRIFTPGVYIFHYYKIVEFAWTKQGQEQYKPYSVATIQVN